MSKRAKRAQCPRDQEGKKAGEDGKKVPNTAMRIAARCLANGCRTPGATKARASGGHVFTTATAMLPTAVLSSWPRPSALRAH